MVPGEYLSSRPVLDELGYLPIDKHGADLLFQVLPPVMKLDRS